MSPSPGAIAVLLLLAFLSPLSVGAQPASVDSLASALPQAPSDSLSFEPRPGGLGPSALDSLVASSDSLAASPSLPPRPPWWPEATLRGGDLERLRAEGLEDALDAMEGTWVRVAGDRGAAAFVSQGPLGLHAPELLYDGVPSRSPADLDPAVYDRSLLPLSAIEDSRREGLFGGDPGFRLEPTRPQLGRTLLRTHFTSTAHESFLRSISATTPRAARGLRLDFEEWKTEEGYNFTLDPARESEANLGRAKMRRFRIGGRAETERGDLSFQFGRGRRFTRGSVLSSQAAERWTGELVAGLDRSTDAGFFRARLYHLDWHDDDRLHVLERDATRLGLRLEHQPEGQGWGGLLEVERWSMRLEDVTGSRIPEPPYVGRAVLRRSQDLGGGIRVRAAAELAYAEHAATRFDGGGRLRVEREAAERWILHAGVERSLRTPTLLETQGLLYLDPAPGLPLRLEGAGALEHEHLERGWVGTRFALGRLELEGSIERWRLRDGIGWQPDADVATSGSGRFVGGLELEVDQASGQGRMAWGGSRRGLALQLSGHRVLGDLAHVASRGAGWPLAGGDGRLTLWHEVRGARNRLALDLRHRYVGRRFDDLLAPFGDAEREPVQRTDLRLTLSIRGTDLYLALDNLLDVDQEEVAGTLRRGRQLRWGIVWPFTN